MRLVLLRQAIGGPNGEVIIINSDLVKKLEQPPDILNVVRLTFTDGESMHVIGTLEGVVERLERGMTRE